MTRYIVSGYIGFDNFGDEAIAHVLSEKLKKSGAERVTLISSNPAKTMRIHGVASCGMLNFLPSLIKSDVLISGGGSLLQDVTSLKSLIYYLGVIYAALILNKKVEIFAQGIGPIKSRFGQLLTAAALKHASKISVRDKLSQNLLKSWGIQSESVNDPVLEMEFPRLQKTGCVGVQLRGFETLTEEFMIRLAKQIKTYFSEKEIIVFSLQDKIDAKVCSRFAELLRQEGLAPKLKFNLDMDGVINTVSNLEYLVAMRFHANVAGLKSGVKTLAINYDPKVAQLAEEYNLPMINLNQEDLSYGFERLVSD